MSVKFMSIALMFLLSVGCIAAEDKNSIPSHDNPDYVYSIDQLYEMADQLHNETVTVQGEFMGWKGCSEKTKMMTRSDWTLSHDQSCVLVNGDFPKGLHPRNKKDMGKSVTIKAIVIYQDGFLNLKQIPF